MQYFGRWGVNSEQIHKGCIVLDFETWNKDHNFKQSLASVIEVAGNTSLLLGSVYKKLTNLRYINNGDFKKQWKSICANKTRLRYRNNCQLIVLCLQNETEFNLQTKQFVINIDEMIDNIDKIYQERQDKVNYFLQKKGDNFLSFLFGSK